MSNIISVLENIGQDARLRHATEEEVQLALANAQVAADVKAAVLDKDPQALEILLNARTKMVCGLMPGKNDEEEEEHEPDKDDDEVKGFAGSQTRIVELA